MRLRGAFQKAKIEKWWPIIEAANIKGNEPIAIIKGGRRRRFLQLAAAVGP
jgi:hypothetical protein